jgi:formylmethanofuran dehydrogenase subunit E
MAFYREDRKMLIDISFKRIVDFHGHLCPDLVLGGKLCVYIQNLPSKDGAENGGMSIIAENSTSALDAIQVMLGATLGNHRLQIMDYGKHNYTLLFQNQENGLRFSLRRLSHDDEMEYLALEQRIISRQAILDEVVQFQGLLDRRVKYLMGLSPEHLFDVVRVESVPRPVETASIYLTCSKCRQQILKSRVIQHQGKTYCIPCSQHSNTGRQGCGLQ